MNSRQRLQATLNHKPADRVCVDMGAGAQTGIGICALHRLRQAVLVEEDYRIKVVEPYQMLSEVDEALRQTLKLDVAGIPTSFVFNTVHNIQSDVPTANMLALFRAVNDARHVQSSFD